jgi:hypothetical protein
MATPSLVLQARELLQEDILHGKVPLEDSEKKRASDVYNMRPLYALCFKDSYEDFLDMLKQERRKIISATPWAQSRAKELLREDILDGTVPSDNNELDAKDVYKMRPEYKRYLFNRFKANLKSLREKIAKGNHYAQYDEEALKNDRLIYPIMAYDSATGKYRWDGSMAQKSLEKDISDGIDKQMSSCRAFWKSRPEYQLFDVVVFQKHVDQEHRAVKNRHRNKKGKEKRDAAGRQNRPTNNRLFTTS